MYRQRCWWSDKTCLQTHAWPQDSDREAIYNQRVNPRSLFKKAYKKRIHFHVYSENCIWTHSLNQHLFCLLLPAPRKKALATKFDELASHFVYKSHPFVNSSCHRKYDYEWFLHLVWQCYPCVSIKLKLKSFLWLLFSSSSRTKAEWEGIEAWCNRSQSLEGKKIVSPPFSLPVCRQLEQIDISFFVNTVHEKAHTDRGWQVFLSIVSL